MIFRSRARSKAAASVFAVAAGPLRVSRPMGAVVVGVLTVVPHMVSLSVVTDWHWIRVVTLSIGLGAFWVGAELRIWRTREAA